ncbi:hypothetical protein MTO98_26370 [Mucilaginibacter sp. SMC90]|uniref:hypothetical protein n=1 Tax=Mucilaginibacter sp. SMC90 TaxID=2929803 RepID=UPI001FB1E48F|nr:hypothetical protein [Mucilaginibacter sp. SMC90]UOE47940.1 hypothetical protein MTO98_26370 [Mucilaginibacter sp. SMC90]
MATEHTTLIVSAFSGLAGALITQALTGLFAYLGDKRKSNIELSKEYRNKKVEIAENYYYVTGETMSILKKSVQLWKGRNIPRSEKSYRSMSDSLKEADARLKQMNIDNWKHSLIGLYFNVTLSYDELIAANNKSHELYLKVLDIESKIREASDDEEDRERLIGQYSLAIFDLCSQYDTVYAILANDMDKVKTNLLATFKDN